MDLWIRQTEGDVIFDGVDTKELWREELTDIRRRKIGFVFQDFNLMDSLSVKENIMLPVLMDKDDQKECEEKALKHWRSSLELNIWKKKSI